MDNQLDGPWPSIDHFQKPYVEQNELHTGIWIWTRSSNAAFGAGSGAVVRFGTALAAQAGSAARHVGVIYV